MSTSDSSPESPPKEAAADSDLDGSELITDELVSRPARAPNLLAEHRALHAVAQQLTASTSAALQVVTDQALSLCLRTGGDEDKYLGTAGVSLLEVDAPTGESVFRWTALSGRLSEYAGATTPRNFSPCGVCVDQDRPILFAWPERKYKYLQSSGQQFVELLLVPFQVGGAPAGTIWVASHDERNHFDFEDARVASSLAAFAGAICEAAMSRDAAEQSRALADEARRQAVEADRAKSEFLATMSHEFRTPLNALTGYVQLLDMGLAGPVTETQREFLQRLSASGRHLTGLVDDVLDLAKVEAGQLTVASEQLMLGDSIEEALALALPQAQATGIRLVDARRNGEVVRFIGDDHRVRQILLNLISNALKFTPSGGTVTVKCGTADSASQDAHVAGDGPFAFIEVSDTGVGIAQEHESAVFEPFYQAESAMGMRYRRTAGGIGLGLTISRRLARLMGGDLTLRSAPNEGATFVLWLPAPPLQPGELEAARIEPAPRREIAGYRSAKLGEITRRLRLHTDEFLESYLARLRADPVLADVTRPLSQVELEDHLASFLPDLFQTLAAIHDAGGLESPNQYDSSVIQRVIAELHGRQRHRLGWSEAQLTREQFLLKEELEKFAHRHIPDDVGDRNTAIEILERLASRSASVSLRGFRHAAQAAGESDDMPALEFVPARLERPADQAEKPEKRQTPREPGSQLESTQRS